MRANQNLVFGMVAALLVGCILGTAPAESSDLLLRANVVSTRVQPIALSNAVVQPVAVAPVVARRVNRSTLRVNNLALASTTAAALQARQIEQIRLADVLQVQAVTNRANLSAQFLVSNYDDLQTLRLLRQAQSYNSLARVQAVTLPVYGSARLLSAGGCH